MMGALITFAFLTVFVTCLASNSNAEDSRQRRDFSMLRMGKRDSYLPPLVPPYSNDEIEKRQMISTPRMGKDLDEAEELEAEGGAPYAHLAKTKSFDDYMREYRHYLAEEEARLGVKRERRAIPLPRLGLAQRSVPLPRLGLRDEVEIDERAVPLPRLGLLVDKRLPRYGLLEEDLLSEEDKRSGMSMLRMGKRQMSMLRMGKREMGEEEKRGLSMLRMGKREEEKRDMSMLRMGRSSDDDKRAMGMLRMG